MEKTGGLSPPVNSDYSALGSPVGEPFIFRRIAATPIIERPTNPVSIVAGSGTARGSTGTGGVVGLQWVDLGVVGGGGSGTTGTTGVTGTGGTVFTWFCPTGTGGKKAIAPVENTVKAAAPTAAAGTSLVKRNTMASPPTDSAERADRVVRRFYRQERRAA